MWHPPERTKHAPLPAQWPNAAAAAASRWFSPLSTGRLNLWERTWLPAMVPWRATESGFVTPEVLDWYARFAEGRPGAIVVEATGVRDIPSGPLLRVGHDRFVPGLKQLTEVVRRSSGGRTRLFLQIIDFLPIRRRPDKTKYFERYLKLTDAHRVYVGAHLTDDQIRDVLLAMTDAEHEAVLTSRELEALRVGYRERVTDVDLPNVRELPKVLPKIFSAASSRAERAGFDGVELHYAHAYTMASFLSARNERADGYGGERVNRVRLPLEVYRAVRAAVSGRFVVGCRYLADECIDGGSGVADATYFGVAFAKAGFDYLSLSRGGKFEDAKPPKVGWAAYPYTGPSGWECMPTVLADRQGPFGRNVPPSRVIRRAVRAAGYETPIVVAGGIHTFDQAEAILKDGAADVIAAARQSLADPDWLQKIRAGRGDEVRRCVFTNYCEGLDQKHRAVTCKLWDRVGLDEPGIPLVDGGKRRLTAPRWEP